MWRVREHPILGPLTKRKIVKIWVDNQIIEAFEGEPIAAALLAAGIRVFRQTTKKHETRGVFCAIGQCTDCVMVVDGNPNVRTCVTPVKEGIRIKTQIGLDGD
ncbi:MAG: (2Fe-2S)-binding protein [Candidatus Heimdallarchaeota archaeon]